jgi:hypothetical protein
MFFQDYSDALNHGHGHGHDHGHGMFILATVLPEPTIVVLGKSPDPRSQTVQEIFFI